MKLVIEGMHCQACVRRVHKALEKVEGVEIESVDVGSAVVGAQPEKERAIVEAVRQAGYEAHATYSA